MSAGQSSGINVQDQGSHAYNENLNETRKMYNLFFTGPSTLVNCQKTREALLWSFLGSSYIKGTQIKDANKEKMRVNGIYSEDRELRLPKDSGRAVNEFDFKFLNTRK